MSDAAIRTQPPANAGDRLGRIIAALDAAERVAFAVRVEECVAGDPVARAAVLRATDDDVHAHRLAPRATAKRIACTVFEALLHNGPAAIGGAIRRSAIEPLWRPVAATEGGLIERLDAHLAGIQARSPHRLPVECERAAAVIVPAAARACRAASDPEHATELRVAADLLAAGLPMRERLRTALDLVPPPGGRRPPADALTRPLADALGEAEAAQPGAPLAWAIAMTVALRTSPAAAVLPAVVSALRTSREDHLRRAGYGPVIDLAVERFRRDAEALAAAVERSPWDPACALLTIRFAATTRLLRDALDPDARRATGRVIAQHESVGVAAVAEACRRISEACSAALRGHAPAQDALAAARLLTHLLADDRDSAFRTAASQALREVKAEVEEEARRISRQRRERPRAPEPATVDLVLTLAGRLFRGDDREGIIQLASRRPGR